MIILIPLSAKGRARLLRVLGWGMLLGSLVFTAAAVGTWSTDRTLSQHGVTTRAVVTRSDYEPNGTSSITVTFTDGSGATQKESIDVADQPEAEGSAVEVQYDPADPATLRLAGRDAGQNMAAAAWAGIGALFILIGLACFAVRKFSRHVSQKGPGGLLGGKQTAQAEGAI